MTDIGGAGFERLGTMLDLTSMGAKTIQVNGATIETWKRTTPRFGTSRPVHLVSPIDDPRWDEYLKRSSGASLFHCAAWLEALRRTYGYEPVVYTTASPNERLENGIVCCRVQSRLTGRRLVSLPFSDHCQPLAEDPEDLPALLNAIEGELCAKGWRYSEMRPLTPIGPNGSGWHTAAVYLHHQIDLQPDLAKLFSNLHRNSVQRKIRRAERERLTYLEGATGSLLDSFYRLMVKTRRRHGLPPQPRKWFQSLMDCFGDALQIRIALKDAKPIAGMLTIRYKDTLVYKYGGSDLSYNKLGGMHLLYWNSIRDAKRWGLHFFDLGRTDAQQLGLVTFKKRWGAVESAISYSRYTNSGDRAHSFESVVPNWKTQTAKFVFAHSPNRLLSILGNLLYRHFG
jgi:CelD/BcsL family acetyltransferase involved in cellulose biosynthesis